MRASISNFVILTLVKVRIAFSVYVCLSVCMSVCLSVARISQQPDHLHAQISRLPVILFIVFE